MDVAFPFFLWFGVGGRSCFNFSGFHCTYCQQLLLPRTGVSKCACQVDCGPVTVQVQSRDTVDDRNPASPHMCKYARCCQNCNACGISGLYKVMQNFKIHCRTFQVPGSQLLRLLLGDAWQPVRLGALWGFDVFQGAPLQDVLGQDLPPRLVSDVQLLKPSFLAGSLESPRISTWGLVCKRNQTYNKSWFWLLMVGLRLCMIVYWQRLKTGLDATINSSTFRMKARTWLGL